MINTKAREIYDGRSSIGKEAKRHGAATLLTCGIGESCGHKRGLANGFVVDCAFTAFWPYNSLELETNFLN